MRNTHAQFVTLAIGTLLLFAGCGKSGQCKTDEDCKSTSASAVCYEGKCVSVKGESGRAASRSGRKEVDPNVTFKVPVDPKKHPVEGPLNAPVTIVEFSDFQCPFCGRAAGTMGQIHKKFPKAVRIVFMNNPLSFHKHAQMAAEVAYAVFKLKGNEAFWKFHDKLFANRTRLGRDNLVKWATELGVDAKKLNEALNKATYRPVTKAQQALATKLGARGAPAFFINGRFVSGAQPFAVFKKKVDEALERAQALLQKGVKPADLYKRIIAKGKTRAVYK